jgi:putative heme transporter
MTAPTSSEIQAGLSEHPEDEIVDAELEQVRRKKKTGKGRIVAIVLSLAVIAGVFAFALPRIANYGDVWDVVKGMTWEWIAALVGAVLLNTATYGPPWVAALPGLGYFHATRVTLASTAMTMVAPGGAAVGMATSFAMLKAWGFRGRPVGLAVVVTGVWNQLVILGIPIFAFLGVVAEGGSNHTLELVALIALGVFVTIVVGFAIGLSSERLARRVGDRAARTISWAKGLIGKTPVKWRGESFVRFREETIELIRHRWAFLTFSTLAGHLTVFLVLLFSLRAVGTPNTEVTFVEAFAAWAIARVLGSIPITPGGVGFVELGLTGVLVAFGASNDEAVAATLIYRFLTVVPTLVFGLVAAATWKLGRRSREGVAGSTA